MEESKEHVLLDSLTPPPPPPSTSITLSIHPFFKIYNSSYTSAFQPELNYVDELMRVISELYGKGDLIKFDNRTNELLISLPPFPYHRIPFSQQQNKKISKQHTYWKGLQYLLQKYQNWKDHFSIISLSTMVICRSCSHGLGPVQHYCFYVKSPTEVSFILHPDYIHEYQQKFEFPESENSSPRNLASMQYPIHCPNCSIKLGCDNSHGPKNSRLFEFGNDKIAFQGSESYQLKWSKLNQLPEFGLICRYNFEIELTKVVDSIQTNSQNILTIPSRKEDFGWEDLIISSMVPRSEQLKAYHQALLSNSIIMLPTGAGKTLIASLTIARFVKLNPKLIAVMLVDRVPLVHQQAKAIRKDVLLSVYPLCGETSSSSIKAKILGGHYDCIVSTAGAFVELFKIPEMTVSRFSVIVFDECHHAVKRHKYCEVLAKVSPSRYQPRLVGLSASPVTGKDYQKIQESLHKIKRNFLNALMYKPASIRSEPEYSWHSVECSEEQKKKEKELQSELEEICERIFPPADLDIEWLRSVPVSSILSKVREIYPQPLTKDIDRIRYINRAFEINKLLGPAYIDRSDDDMHSFDLLHLSPFLLKMEDIISQLPSLSRTIVFVDQKPSAKLIQRRLQYSFPDLNPAYIVGNNGWDGMTWREQSEILKSFNRKEGNTSLKDSVRLIVSTSVLEEGLDVQSCETVFRFGGRSSLIQFVQSRGRARSGRMHIILTPSDRLHIDKILKEEQILNQAFHVESKQSEKLLDEAYRKLEFDLQEDVIDNLQYLPDEISDDAKSVALKFYANCPHDKAFYPFIDKELKSLGFISSVTHLLVDFGQSRIESASPMLFEVTDSIINVNVATDSPFLDFFLYLISMWRFSIPIMNSNRIVDIYFPLPSTLLSEIPFTQPVSSVNDIIKVEVGFLRGRRSYEVAHLLGSDNLRYNSFSIDSKNIWRLEGLFENQRDSGLTIQSPICQLFQFALISADQKLRTLTLYFFTKVTPVVLYSKGDDTTRVACCHPLSDNQSSIDPNMIVAQEELQKIVQTPMFSITFPLSKWMNVLAMITENGLKFDLYFTHLIEEGSVGVDHLKRDMEFAKASSQLLSKYPFESLTTIERRVLFSIYSMSSIFRELLFSPASLHEIKIDAFETLGIGINNRIRSKSEMFLEQLYEIIEQLPGYLRNKSIWNDPYEIFKNMKENITNCLLIAAASQDADPSQNEVHESTESIAEIPKNSTDEPLLNVIGYKYVYRVLITPSQVIFRPSYLIKTNRLLRKYHEEEFAYVAFVDEDTNPIFNHHIFSSRYLHFLVHGFHIGSTPFSFLLCSASQQREQRAIFICGDNQKAQSIRDSIASFADFKGDIPKYMSRLGLFCTADTHVGVQIDTLEIEPDIFTHEHNDRGGKILTDGAGKISLPLLNKVRSSLPDLPSFNKPFCAFQFRLGGYKGVLYQTNDLKCDIVFRESNLKFQCPENDLGLVQPALYHQGKLNREMLNLLFSFSTEGEHGGKWDPFPYVRRLQRAELALLGDIFIDQDKAIAAISERLRIDELQDLCASSFDFYEDFFVKKMLSVIYNYRCRMLRTKVHIPLKKGVYLMGICDPTGLLKDGEIFYQIKDSSQPLQIGIGRHLIFRNPCLDPGDLRLVDAVEIEELKEYYNVVVFPASTACRRSLTAECSGGDLDGDMFSIIADENLVPPGQFNAVDYELIAQEAKSSAPSPNKNFETTNNNLQIAQFLVRAMTNSNLGRIARLHLALCDHLPLRAADQLARKLARTQSLAVDFVKTGVPPSVPKEAKEIVKRNGYPSFMENKSKPSYVSVNPLGILYDDVISGTCDYIMDRKLVDPDKSYIDEIIEPNSLFFYPGKEKYELETRKLYTEYCSTINGILSRFSLKSDAELVLAIPEILPPELMRDQGAVEQSLLEIWSCIKQKYKIIFQSVEECELLSRASAWHFVAYSTQPYMMSFSWIVSDYLLSIAKINSSLHTGITNSHKIFLDIGQSIVAYWVSIREDIYEIVNSKLIFFEKLERLILSSCVPVKIHLYGSVQLLLCDADSDLDVYVESGNSEYKSKSQQLDILRDFAPLVESEVCSMTIVDAAVPIIRGYLEDGQGFHQSLDFSACSDGYYKALYLRYFYSLSNSHLIVMSALMNWARFCRLIPVANDDEAESDCLRKGEFHALVLSILDDDIQKPNFETIFTSSVSNEFIMCDTFSPDEIGSKVLKFFQIGKDLSYDEDYSYTWSVPGSPVHTIKSTLMQRVTIACSRAYHSLVRSRDWSFLQQNAIACDTAETVTKIRIPANSILAKMLLNATRWHIMNLEYNTHATVTISLSGEYCEIEGRGTRQQIMKLRQVFRQYYQKSKRYLSGSMRSNCSAYFMANSTLLYCRNAYSTLSKVKFEPYVGPKHDQHSFAELSRVLLFDSNAQSNDSHSWQEEYKKILKGKFLQQLEAMILQPKELVTVTVHFGTFYTVNAHDCFRSSEITLHDLSQAHLRGRTEKMRECFDNTIMPNLYSQIPQPSSDTDTPPNLSSSSSISSSGNSSSRGLGEKNRKRSGLSTSFWNSVNNWRAPTSSPENLESTIRKIFTTLGYSSCGLLHHHRLSVRSR